MFTSFFLQFGCERLVIENKSVLVAVRAESEEISVYYVYEGISLRDKKNWAQSDLDALRLAQFQYLPSNAEFALEFCEFGDLRFFVDPARLRKLCADRRMTIRNRTELAEAVNEAINKASRDSMNDVDNEAIQNGIRTTHTELVRLISAKSILAPIAFFRSIEVICRILAEYDLESIQRIRDATQADFRWLRFDSNSIQLVLPATVQCASEIVGKSHTQDWLTDLRANISPIELSQCDEGLVLKLGSNERIIRLQLPDDGRYATTGEKKVAQLAGSPQPIIVDGKAESVESLALKFILEKADFRPWSDISGKSSVRAKFGGMVGGKALLLKEDGSNVYISSDQLATADREYLKVLTNSDNDIPR